MSLARAHERVRVQNVRDFPQTKLDSEINAPFLLNEHGDPTFYFIISMKTISSITGKKISRNIWLLHIFILANEINTTERDITGPTPHIQIMLPLKDKKMQDI